MADNVRSEQQYKEQIDKLSARLQKAAEVFKTQKTDVERAQKERDEALIKVNELEDELSTIKETIKAAMSEMVDGMKTLSSGLKQLKELL